MGLFYLLHEYTERYHPDFTLGKKFARTVILGFVFYYVIYFILPLYVPMDVHRLQHFIRYLIVVDVLASSIFYGGMLNSISFWSTGKTVRPPHELQFDNPEKSKQELQGIQNSRCVNYVNSANDDDDADLEIEE